MKSNVPKRLMKKKPNTTSVSIQNARAKKRSALSGFEKAKSRKSATSPDRSQGSSTGKTLKSSATGLSQISPGDLVECTWPCDPAYGISEMRCSGRVTRLDDWITVVSKLNVVTHMPISMLRIRKLGGSDS